MIKRLLKSIAFGILIIIFPVAAGVITQVNGIEDIETAYLIQAICFVLAAIIGGLIYRKYRSKPEGGSKYPFDKVLYFIPIIIMELIVLIPGYINEGFHLHNNLKLFGIILIFTLAVGFSEEFFFRGIILKILRKDGVLYSIIVSSIVFGLLHASNLLGGANVLYTLLQIIYALLFGLVAASIVTLHQSLTPVIIWHFLHDFLAFSMGDRIHGVEVELSPLMIVLSIVQILVMLLYTIYLYKQIKQTGILKQSLNAEK